MTELLDGIHDPRTDTDGLPARSSVSMDRS
jgi:hypothetical protein